MRRRLAFRIGPDRAPPVITLEAPLRVARVDHDPAFEVWDELAHADDTVHFAMLFWTGNLLSESTMDSTDADLEVQDPWGTT